MLGVSELGLNGLGVAGVRGHETRASFLPKASGVGVAGVRGRETRASLLPKASLTTRNSHFGWFGLGVAPNFLQKVRAQAQKFGQ